MYDIVTLEPDDDVVAAALETIKKGKMGVVPGPGGNFRIFTSNGNDARGNGGASVNALVIVGHGNANIISKMPTWAAYQKALPGNWQLEVPTQVFIVACSTNKDGRGFLTGNIAREVKRAYPRATVWASDTGVDADDLTGDWQKVSMAA